MIYGYVRVSTAKQNIDRQKENILTYCLKNGLEFNSARFYEDKYTGTSLNRPNWEKLFKKVSEGDTIIFDEVSRMSRNAEEGYKAYMELNNRGVNLVFLKEPHVNTETFNQAKPCLPKTEDEDFNDVLKALEKYMQKLVRKQIELAFEMAQKERDFLSMRTKEGIKASPNKSGHKVGDTYETQKSKESKEKIRELSNSFNGNLTDRKVIEYIGISKPTYYKYKRELLKEIGREED